MLTFLAFCVVLLGCLNWLVIGMVQFDLVAGIFGSQANIFSRIIYIIVGIAAAYLLTIAIKQKGKINCSRESSRRQKNEEDMLGS